MSVRKYYFFDKNTSPKKNLSLEDAHFSKIGKSLKIRKPQPNDTIFYRDTYGRICKAVITKIADSEVYASDSGKPVILKSGEYFYSSSQIKEQYSLPDKIQKGDVVKYNGGMLSVNAVENGVVRGFDVANTTKELILGPGEYTPYLKATNERIEKSSDARKKEVAKRIKNRFAGGAKGTGAFGIKESVRHLGNKPLKGGEILNKQTVRRTVTKKGNEEIPVRKWSKEKKKFVGEPKKYKRNVGGHKAGDVKKVSRFQQFMRRYPGALMKKFGMGRAQAMAAALKKARMEGLYNGDEDLDMLMVGLEMDWAKSKQIVKSQTVRGMRVLNLPFYQALGMALAKAEEAGSPMIEKSADMLLDSERSAKFKNFMEHEVPKLKKKGFKTRRAIAAALSEARKKHLTKYPPKKDEDLLKESKEAQEYISEKIKKLRHEGYKPDQAAAIAYSYARRKGFDVPEKDLEYKETDSRAKEDAKEIQRHVRGIEHEAEEIMSENEDEDLQAPDPVRLPSAFKPTPASSKDEDLDWTKMGIYQLEKDLDLVGAPLGSVRPERRKGSPEYFAWLQKFKAALKYAPNKMRALHEKLARRPQVAHADTEKSAHPEIKGEESGLPSLAKYNKEFIDKKFPKSKFPPRAR